MDAVAASLAAHGYWLLFAVGFMEFGGIPIASLPLLALAGSFVAHGELTFAGAAASAAAGGALADLGWYSVARRYGEQVIQVACGLATEPGVCILRVQARVAELGALSLVIGKAVPGMGNLTAPAAGLSRLALGRFLAADAAGLLIWASGGTFLGWLLVDQIDSVARWLSNWMPVVLLLAFVLVAVATGIRLWKVRRHMAAHERSFLEDCTAIVGRKPLPDRKR